MGDINKEFTLKRAQNAVLSRDFVLAARLFKTILKEEPNNIDVLSQLGSAYVRSGDDLKALEVYNRIIQIENTNFNALNNLGGIYRRLKKYEESIMVLERALATGANPNEVYYNMGHTYKLMGNYDDAADCFVTVIEENPNDVLAYNHLGSIQAARGEHSKALQSYSRALQIDKNHPILHYNSALSYIALGQKEEAKLSFENALRTRPGWVEAMVDYADLLIGMNKNKEAQDLLSQAQRLNAEDINILNALGKLNLKQKDYSMAEQNYQSVLAKNSEDYRALFGMALVYEKQRKLLDSQMLFEKLENFDNENDDIVLQHSRVLLKLHELEKAFSRINRICQNNPKNCDALNLLSQYYIHIKDEPRKNGCFKRIHDTDPKYINHLLDCAEVYIDLGNFSSGEIILTQYLTKRRNDTEALMIMASLHEASQNYATALQIYRRVFELEPQNIKILETINRLSQNISFSDTTEPLPEYLNPLYVQDDFEDSYDESYENLDESIDENILNIPPESNDSKEKNVIFNLDNISNQEEELPPEPLEFITEGEEESLSFANMDDQDTTVTTLDDLVDYDEPLDVNPALENDPLFDELLPSDTESQLPLVEDEDVVEVSNEKDEISFGNEFEDDYPVKNENPPMYNPVQVPSAESNSDLEENTDPNFEDDQDLNEANLDENLDVEIEPDTELISSPEDIDQIPDIAPDSDFGNTADFANEDDFNELPQGDFAQNPINQNLPNGQVSTLGGNSQIESDNSPEANSELSSSEDLENETNDSCLATPKSSLQGLVQSLQDALIAKKYENTSELFDVLDELCSYLPDSIKDRYLSSLDRLRLEYLRSKMTGKPGLMTIVEELRKKHPEEFADFDDTKELTEEMIIKTFIYMNSLSKELPNKNISSLLTQHLDQAIRTIRD